MPRKEYIAWFDMPTNGKLHGQSIMPKQELIRCKDCKWHIKGGFCDLYFADRAADEYCSRAERKEE